MTLHSILASIAPAASTVVEAAGSNQIYIAYAIFLAIVVGFLALDLGVFHREAKEISIKEAASWSVVWVTMGLLFAVVVYFGYEKHWLGLGLNTPMYNPASSTDPTAPLIIRGTVEGAAAAEQYLTGYVLEKSLAMDNIFVIALIFGFFAIPRKYQHRVLFWGILGALVMRGVMILVGGALIMQYQWILILFGLILLATVAKMLIIKEESDPSQNVIVRLVRKFYPVTNVFHGQKFWVRVPQSELAETGRDPDGKVKDIGSAVATSTDGSKLVLAMTPLFLALIMVEITDLVFAVDSIPAIFAITPDPFIVFTSNIFAILGLRALYFCLAALIAKFRFLKPALIIILFFVAIKLLLLSVPPYLDVIGLDARKSIKIDTTYSMLIVFTLLGGAVLLSAILPPKKSDHQLPTH
jgi:tellurite resistance protein TerC